MMKDYLKMAGSLILIAFLIAHFFFVAFLIAPTDRLLGMLIGQSSHLVSATDIPEDVSRFLRRYNIGVEAEPFEPADHRTRLIASVLELREGRFMSDKERLALRANLLDFEQGVKGLSEAAEFYYGKPLSQLKDHQWVTLFNLHNIYFLK